MPQSNWSPYRDLIQVPPEVRLSDRVSSVIESFSQEIARFVNHVVPLTLTVSLHWRASRLEAYGRFPCTRFLPDHCDQIHEVERLRLKRPATASFAKPCSDAQTMMANVRRSPGGRPPSACNPRNRSSSPLGHPLYLFPSGMANVICRCSTHPVPGRSGPCALPRPGSCDSWSHSGSPYRVCTLGCIDCAVRS